MSLKNARVLVIGGTSGIGLGVASAATERGAIPIVVSRHQSSVDRALSQLPEHARGATIDLTDPSALERLAADIGNIEHLVFTAGESLALVSLADLTPEIINRYYQTRLVGGAQCGTRIRSAHHSRRVDHTHPWHGGGPARIRGNARQPLRRDERADQGAGRGAGADSGQRGRPGVVRTALCASFSETDRQAMYEQVAQRLPLARIGEATDTARAYLYCMEQEWGTGIVLTVDGGTVLV
jgi:NAD(P)-dependent dehydrogenase (short-subunit alcohol dehydrogenase family)